MGEVGSQKPKHPTKTILEFKNKTNREWPTQITQNLKHHTEMTKNIRQRENDLRIKGGIGQIKLFRKKRRPPISIKEFKNHPETICCNY